MKFTQRLSWILLATLFVPLIADAATFSYGTSTTYASGTTSYASVSKIDSSHVIATFRNSSAQGVAQIGTIDGTTITFGTTYQFTSTAQATSVSVLDSTHAFITYTTAGAGYGVIATISGTAITYGTPVQFSSSMRTGNKNGISVALDSTHVLVEYVEETADPFDMFGGTVYNTWVVAASISGTSITFGSASTLTSDNSGVYISAGKLDSTHAAVIYATNSGASYVVVFAISGTSISHGSAVQYVASGSDGSLAVLDSTHGIIVYRGSDNNGYAVVATISGTTVSVGSASTVNSGTTYYTNVEPLTSSTAMFIYRDQDNSGIGKTRLLTVSAGTVSSDSASVFLNTAISNIIGFTALDSTSVMILSATGDTAIVATTDTTAPSAPSSFTATPTSSTVALSWTNPVDSDFLSNSIRSGTGSYPTSISDGRSVASGVTETSTTDTGLSDGTYYYSIFARDLRGNYSTVAHATATVDGTAPASPGSFTATASNTTISLSWTNPVDSDFSSVSIRKASGDYPSSITAGTALVSNSTATSASDSGLSEGAYFYSIFAIDTAGNVSTAAHATTAVITGNKSSGGSAQSGGGGGGAHRAAAASTRTSTSPSPSVAHPAATTSSPSPTPLSTPSHSPAAQTPVAQVLTTVRVRLEERVQQQIAAQPGVAPMLKKMLARMEARIAKVTARVSRK